MEPDPLTYATAEFVDVTHDEPDVIVVRSDRPDVWDQVRTLQSAGVPILCLELADDETKVGWVRR